MAKWLTTESCERLTKTEVKAELENFLRNCKNEEDFLKECRCRFQGPLVTVEWGNILRSVSICRHGKNESIYASVFL